MSLNFKFAIISDLHIALPHTIWDHPSRFHLVEISIPALEIILERLEQLAVDFLLLPGDLTQHGEAENHRWLAERLARFPFPTYVVPGNHDVPYRLAQKGAIALEDFPHYYQPYGYSDPAQLYYTCQLLPGVRLIGLNSNQFDATDTQVGRVDQAQLDWLQGTLASYPDDLILVMIHHNIVEHLPGQSRHPLSRRYMLENAPELVTMLQAAGVQLVFTGHLHVQDIAQSGNLYDITTGSLVSYPHPYRLLQFRTDHQGQQFLHIESHRVEAAGDWADLQHHSREWMGDHSVSFMMKLLTSPPLNLPQEEAVALAPDLRYFWSKIADGDAVFDFPQFSPRMQRYFKTFSAVTAEGKPQLIDNCTTLSLQTEI